MNLARLKEPFPREDVQWRAQTVTKSGDKALALAYFDARAAMDRLDEVCGPENWQCRYLWSPDAKKTVCEIGIRMDAGDWVWKADGAGDSDVEAEKGALSDAFKRAAVKWGVGRYLYDLPQLWVPCETYNGRFSKFTVDPWTLVRNPRPPQQQPPSAAAPHPSLAAAPQQGAGDGECVRCSIPLAPARAKWCDDHNNGLRICSKCQQQHVQAHANGGRTLR